MLRIAGPRVSEVWSGGPYDPTGGFVFAVETVGATAVAA